MTGSVEKVYSQALLELAYEIGDDAAAEIDEELAAIADIFSANPGLYDVLGSPTVTDEEKRSLINELFEGKISRTVLGLLCVLTESGRCRYLGAVTRAYRKAYYEKSGIAEVCVTTVKPLTPDQKERLISKLSKLYAKKIILTEKIDESIVGGMIVNCGDSMLDGSVKTKLENMRKQIKDMIA